jgi:Ca2+/H+ antiporter
MDIIFRSFLALMLLFVGLAALIGGIKKSPNPFFWTQPGRTSYLKTPVHYILFGIACLLAVVYWVYRLMVIYHVF